MTKTEMEYASKFTPAIEWVVRPCASCGREFHQKKQNEKTGVYRQNCAPCRQRMGHPTAVDWRKSGF